MNYQAPQSNQTASPIADLLFARRESGSKPGKRSDGRFVSLVIEGGAMRGVISAGMVTALEHLGLRDSFDAVYGSSAGAITGAYFTARQAAYGTTIFYENINNSFFIDLKRLMTKRPVVSLEFLLDDVCLHQKRLNADAVINSDLPLSIIATSLSKKRAEPLSCFETAEELFRAMKASARIPFFAGPPIVYRDDRYLDASLFEPIPFRAAMEPGLATDIVVLLTRPLGVLRREPSLLDRHLVAPHLARLDAALAAQFLSRPSCYREEIDVIEQHAGGAKMPRMLPIRLSQGTATLSPFEKSRSRLVAAAMQGFTATYKALGVEEPQVVEVMQPFYYL